ncbi:MAG TPA: LysR family transcriptional regulator [Steroidobacteraceae bacterium]|nr:LysR family transcriptional regulator [Steroidobacteraceae bacterium]
MQAPAVRFRVDFGREGAVGPGKIALLEHIGTGGSLSQAARELGMSYRRAWQLLESLNSCFREPVVQSAKGGRGGGGARLTPLGRLLIRVYREFEAEVQKRAARSFRPVAGLARQSARGTAPIVALKDRRKA